MIHLRNMQQHARKLLEPELCMQVRYELAKEVKNGMEIVYTSEYLNFLQSYFWELYYLLLHRTKPQMENSDEHKLRKVIIEILSRLPHNRVLQPYVQDLLSVAMHVLRTDNEENGLVCLRIVRDLHRSFTSTLEPEVQPFLDFVQTIYQNFKTIGTIPEQLNPSTASLKIVTKCCPIMMLLFNFHGHYVHKNVTVLLPLMVDAISIPGPRHISPHLRNHHAELKCAQVKIVSFLAYLLKTYVDSIQPYEENISKSIVNLFLTCPNSILLRKELLYATREFLETFRRGFFPWIDTLLEERVLVGNGRACFETLRPLAYSTLVKLIHQVRMEISFNQLSQIINLFSRNMYDSSLAFSTQTTSARLMLNLAEPIFIRGVDTTSKEKARALLGSILETFVSKLRTLKHTIPQLIGDCEDGKEYCSLRFKLELPQQAALNFQMPFEHSKELSDCKQLIQTLIIGLKTLVWSITHLNASEMYVSQPSSAGSSHGLKGMKEEEVRLTTGVLRSGVHCLSIFKDTEEENEMLLHFSQIFAWMENRNLTDMFATCMQYLFEYMLKNDQVLTVFSNLLQTGQVVRYFADVLVNFLVSSKLDILKQPDKPASKLVLHLFHVLFVAVAKCPLDCKCVLQPYVSTIMDVCVKNASEMERPHGYMQLLHSMFHTLSGEKFELLFGELLPTPQPLLNLLLAMVEGSIGVDMKDLVLELCLRIPARFSSLLPYLPRLMKPLVLTLKGSDELIDLGLRTLEFWIDKFKLGFLETCMENDISELSLILWSHIRPKPYPWGEKALQVLGKLGGKNRRFLKEPLALECKENSEHGLRLILTVDPATSYLMPLDRCIYLVIATVMQNKSDVGASHKRHGLKFLRVCLSSVLNLKGNVPGGVTPGLLSMMLMSSIDPSSCSTRTSEMKVDQGMKTKTQLMAEQSVFKALLMTVIAASAEPDLQDPMDEFVHNVCRHFSMIFHVNLSTTSPSVTSGQHGDLMGRGSGVLSSTSQSLSHSNLRELNPLIFLDALVDLLIDENRAHAKASLNAMNIFVETLIFLACCQHNVALTQSDFGTTGVPRIVVTSPSMNPIFTPPPGVHIPVFEEVLSRLLHCCYGSTWQAQMGGVMGIGALLGKITIETLCLFQVRAVRGLVYVLGRLPKHANKEQAETSGVLTHLLRVLNYADEADRERHRQSFQGVVDVLAAEIFNPNATLVVRKNVQSCLTLLASRTGIEVSELLQPLYQPLLQPLIMGSLRSKHIEQQVGTVMAINFCLSLRPPLLNMSQEFVNILQEALQITEADENLSAGKFLNSNLVVKTKLRTLCIELLRTAMGWDDFKTSTHTELRCRIISMFFKSLTCGNTKIVTIAKDGLRQVIQQQELPEELLHTNLESIFLNSVDTGNFTMPLLQGLAELVEFLSNRISIRLGKKLLEHLKKWQESEKVEKAWKVGQAQKIVAAIIELFHHLPPAAGTFLDDLVVLTMELEADLPQGQVYSELNNPYRLPLTKFLTCYASDAVEYFLVRLNQPKYYRRFMDIIRSEAGQHLREELARSSDKIIANAFPQAIRKPNESTNSAWMSYVARNNYALVSSRTGNSAGMQSTAESADQMPDAHFQGISLVSTLVKLIPEWLSNNRPVFDALVLVWKSNSRQARVLDEQFLSVEQVAERYTPQMKKAILVDFLALFQSKELSQNQIVIAMQILILPMLVHAFQNGQNWDVVDSSIIKTIVEKLLDPPGQVSAVYDEPLRIELLQLATILLKYLPRDLVEHKQKLYKFGRNHLMEGDSASKQWAFVNVCHLLNAYDFPEESILEVYHRLLKTCQPEDKVLANQALDILIPSLPRIFPAGAYQIPVWILWTKNILVEERHSFANLIHIFQLIVRHSDLFYSCRALFVPELVYSLTRLGLPHNSSPQNRYLAIELAGLIVEWEKQRQAEAKAATDTRHVQPVNTESSTLAAGGDFTGGAINAKQSSHAAGSSDDLTKRVNTETGLPILGMMSLSRTSTPNIGTAESAGRHEEFKPNSAMQEIIINFLIKAALVIEPKEKEMSAVHEQAIEMLSQCLEVWPTANVKFNYLENLLSSSQPLGQSKHLSMALARGLDVMNKVLEKQPRLFILNNFQQISQLIRPYFNSKVMHIEKLLCTSLKMVFDAFPLNARTTPRDIILLHTKFVKLIKKHLAVVTAPQNSLDITSANLMISSAVSAIKTLAKGKKDFVDYFMMPLIGVLQRFTKEIRMLTRSIANQVHTMDHEPSTATERLKFDLGAITSNLESILKLVGGRGMLVPKCNYLISQIVQSLMSEEGTDVSVLLAILHMIKDWIENNFRSSSPGTSNVVLNKDIVLHLERLSQVNRQKLSTRVLEEWDGGYLQLLYRLCSDSTTYPLSVRQEVFQNVERKYMLGLRAKDPDMRQKFLSLYHESLGKTVFRRLEYVIQSQEWEALSDVFWVKQGLDLLLDITEENKPIELAPTSAQVPPLLTEDVVVKHARMQQVGNAPEEIPGTPPTFTESMNKHARFLNEARDLQVADVLIPLRELAHTDANVAYHLWVLVFSYAWNSLKKDEQAMLANPMITLLSKDYHIRQKDKRPNVIQALLEGLYLSSPRPKIPSQLVMFLGKSYNAWHIAASILESHVMLFPHETSCSEALEALAELYRMLNEKDLHYGLWKKNLNTPEIRAGLSLVQHGYWQRAQDLFYMVMSKAAEGTHNNSFSQGEMNFCHDQWISCARQLNQWEILVDYAKDIKDYEILLDCLWKIPDWVFLKENVLPKAHVEDTTKFHIVQAYLALHDGSITGVTEAENILASGVDMALNHWWQLPETSLDSHLPILQQFQQLVELQESGRVLIEIGNGNNQHVGITPGGVHGGYVDLQDIFETWRVRSPNDWDNLSVWNDLLQWRIHIYNAVINSFKDLPDINPRPHQLGCGEKAWSINKLAHVARKQGVYEVCVTELNKMDGYSTMEVQEAFFKIREQAKAYLEMGGELITGMNLINSTNLEIFKGQQKAEIFRLKGEYFQKMNEDYSANHAYSFAISISRNLSKGWISWGNYCDQVYKESNEELGLHYAVSCFLQGIMYGASNARSHLARVLYLLSFDTRNEPAGKAFDKYLDQIPQWLWLSWIPQLLLSLQRPEASHCKLVLLKIATNYPQALYYWLRTYCLERGNIASKSELGKGAVALRPRAQRMPASVVSSSSLNSVESNSVALHPSARSLTSEVVNNQHPRGGSLAVKDAVRAYEAAKYVMLILRDLHRNLASELEIFLTEIHSIFVPLPEERLLSAMDALLNQCYKYPTAKTTEVPQFLKNELSSLCRDFFPTDCVNKHVQFLNEYKPGFEQDLDPDNTSAFPATLSELTVCLKYWKNALQTNVEDRFPAVLKLDEESSVLCELHVLDLEVPGQYFADKEVSPDLTVKLDRIGADLPIVQRNGSYFRRLTLVGSDGSRHRFLIRSLIPSEERMVQLFRVLNRMFDKHKESRSRHLAFHTPIIIPVWPEVCMVEDDLMSSTLGEVYETSCARYGRDSNVPITYFMEHLNPAIIGQLPPESVAELRLNTYNEITSKIVSQKLFSQYMHETLPIYDHLWAFRKQFAVQLALSGFISYMLQIGSQAPKNILFAKNSAKIFQNNFHPAYDANGMIEFNDPVPFRLTRNLQSFLTPFGVEGLFVSAMCAAAQSIIPPKSQHVQHHLGMFFRDELLSWSGKRPLGMPSSPPEGGGINPIDLRQKVTTNVEQVIGRLKAIAPQCFPEEDENATEPPQSVQRGVTELVEAAQQPKSLCLMDPTWHPWF